MGRSPKFSRHDMLRAALELAADAGPHALTIVSLAAELGAPTGSIYHRFDGREQILAELWMQTVEGFQSDFIAALARADDAQGAIAAVRRTLDWTRRHVREARLLLLHRRQDFVPGAWPPSLVARAAALEPALGEALRAFARRALGRADANAMVRVRYALLDAPLGGVKPYLQAGKPPPRELDALVAETLFTSLARASSTTSAPVRDRR